MVRRRDGEIASARACGPAERRGAPRQRDERPFVAAAKVDHEPMPLRTQRDERFSRNRGRRGQIDDEA